MVQKKVLKKVPQMWVQKNKIQKIVSNVFLPPICIIDPQFQDHPQLWWLYENLETRNKTKLRDGIWYGIGNDFTNNFNIFLCFLFLLYILWNFRKNCAKLNFPINAYFNKSLFQNMWMMLKYNFSKERQYGYVFHFPMF